MRKTYKYRIYLTNGQRRLLEEQLEICRWVYNQTLAERKRAYEERGESLRLYDVQAMLPVWKRIKPELKAVHSHVLQHVQVRVEHLAPQEMGKSSEMRKSIRDVAWSQFIGMTVSKAAEAGRRVILVDARNTSKMCSRCGELVAKTLSERTHCCLACGVVLDRDVNAAITILQRGLHTLQTENGGVGRHSLEAHEL